MKRIAIFFAMLAEAQPIITHYGMTQNFSYLTDDTSFIRLYICHNKNAEIFLVTPGVDPRYQVDRVGPVPAALAVWEIIHKLKPEIIINAGTAGAFAAKGAEVGDVYLAKSPVKYHDRRISLGSFREYGIGAFDCLAVNIIAEKLGLKLATISTGSSLDQNPADFAELKYHQADLKEMEAAAVAEACYLSGFKNLILIKAVTNLLDKEEHSEKQFQNNLALASYNLAKQLVRLIAMLEEE